MKSLGLLNHYVEADQSGQSAAAAYPGTAQGTAMPIQNRFLVVRDRFTSNFRVLIFP